MSKKFLIRTIGSKADIAYILIPTALDTMTAYQLQEKIESLIQNGIYKYIINLEDIEYISSAGVEALYRLQRELHGKHGGVILTSIPKKIFDLFDKIGVMTMFGIADTVEQAIKEFELKNLILTSKNVKIGTIGAQSDILLIKIRGSLDTVVAYHLQEKVEKLIEQGYWKYLIDLEKLDYISSSGVGLFSAIILDLQRHHGQIIFINIPEQIYEILNMTQIIQIFTIAETMEEAIKELEAIEISK